MSISTTQHLRLLQTLACPVYENCNGLALFRGQGQIYLKVVFRIL